MILILLNYYYVSKELICQDKCQKIRKTKLPALPTLCNYGKTRMFFLFSQFVIFTNYLSIHEFN